MTGLAMSFFVLDVLLWLVLTVVKAMQPTGSALSAFELRRRQKEGDQSVVYEAWRVNLLPRLHGAKWLIEMLLTFAAITVVFSTLNLVSAVLVSLGALLVTDVLSRAGFMRRYGAHLYDKLEPGVLRRIERYGALDWFKRAQDGRSLQVASKAELVRLIDQAAPGVLSRDERTMMTQQLAFADKVVADVMTPRTMIDSTEVDDAIGPLLLDRLHHTGHSRFPVIDGDLDHVVGMLYLHALVVQKTSHRTAKQAMDSAVYYIGAQRGLDHALHAFLRTHHHLFIVVNEYRETVGLLSLEDVIEAMIGRSIVDEFDAFEDLRSVAASNPKLNNDPKGKKDL